MTGYVEKSRGIERVCVVDGLDAAIALSRPSLAGVVGNIAYIKSSKTSDCTILRHRWPRLCREKWSAGWWISRGGIWWTDRAGGPDKKLPALLWTELSVLAMHTVYYTVNCFLWASLCGRTALSLASLAQSGSESKSRRPSHGQPRRA